MLLGLGELGRGDVGVDGDPDGRLDHHGDDAGQIGAGELQTGVCVHLDQVGLQVLVDHEVQAEDLKLVLASFGAQLLEDRLDALQGDVLHLGDDVLDQVELGHVLVLVDVALEVLVGELVARLVLAVLLAVLLDGVVGQVDHAGTVLEGEFLAGCAQIAVSTPVGLEVASDHCDDDVASNVKLSLLVE